MQVKAFFDETTNSVSYVVVDPQKRIGAIIDPVLDFDAASGRISYVSASKMVEYVESENLSIEWILETHIHADHLSAAPYLKKRLGGQTGVGAGVVKVQETFASLFNMGNDFARDGSQFDRLFQDGEQFSIGSVQATVLTTPGHTPACVTYVIGDVAFVGDTVFMPDFGTARCDFPDGDARLLYDSIQRIFALPGETRLYMCHDYKAPGREVFAWETTVAEQRARNVHIGGGRTEEDFVTMRQERDGKLNAPRLLLPAVQVNMWAGRMPTPEANGRSYLKIPIDAL